MKVALLTSSRADLGIQLPLIGALSRDQRVELDVVAFGHHSAPDSTGTLDELVDIGVPPARWIAPVQDGDSSRAVAEAMGRVTELFAAAWDDLRPDVVIALGDRSEMLAAVLACAPFDLPVAHLHGGEVTLGAIDNAFRDSLTHLAALHYVAAEPYGRRVHQLVGDGAWVRNVGALSIDGLRTTNWMTDDELSERLGIDVAAPMILVTYHPETVDLSRADRRWSEFERALDRLATEVQLVVTMPNADAGNERVRRGILSLASRHSSVVAFDSLGSRAYRSCMRRSALVLGNSSSGYIEASHFPTWVIDVGERQTGRLVTPNIVRCPDESDRIVSEARRLLSCAVPEVASPYGDGHAAERIRDDLLGWYNTRHGLVHCVTV